MPSRISYGFQDERQTHPARASKKNIVVKKISVSKLLRPLFLSALIMPALGAAALSQSVQPPFDKKILVDIFGLGSFNRTSTGSFASQVVRNSFPAGYPLPDSVSQVTTPQLSGRPGWGGGVGVTAMVFRNLGLNIDQAFLARSAGNKSPESADFPYIRLQTSGALIAKLPISALSAAPYILAGAGAQYGNWPRITIRGHPSRGNSSYTLAGQGFGQVGAGVEFWLTDAVGIFGDARWLFSAVPGLPRNQAQIRYCVRAAL